MTIEAEMHDGTVLEFPDGTSREVIQATVKKRLGGAAPPAGQQPIFQPMKDFGDAVVGAGSRVVDNISRGYQETKARALRPMPSLGSAIKDEVGDLGKTAGGLADAVGAILSPIQGLTDAAMTGPGARAMTRIPIPQTQDVAANKDYLNSALMGARPRAGVGLFGARAPIPAASPAGDLQAGRVLQRAITRDMQQPMDVVNAARANPGAPLFHAGGQNLRGLAEVLAKSPGPGEQIIPQAVRAHQAQATDRVSGNIAHGLGGRNDYFATVDALNEGRQRQVQPLMQQAFSAPVAPDVYQSEIAPIMARLPRGALEQAYDIARRDGRNPEDIGFTRQVNNRPSPGGGSVDAPSTVRVANPTMETLHYIKKGMDQTLEQYRNPVTGALDLTGSPGAQADSRVRSALGRTMRQINPHYDEAMRVWGDESDHISALSLGRDVFSPKFDMQSERLGGQVGEMSDASRDLFRKGVGEAVLAQARSAKGGVGAARQLLRSREFGDRVRLAFPSQRSFDDFMGAMDNEVTMQDRSSRIVGGSPTYPLQAARADVEAQAMDPLDALSGALEGGFNPGRLAGRAAQAAIRAIPRQDRSVVGNPMLNETASRALLDPEELARILNAPRLDQARRASILNGRVGTIGRLLPPTLVLDRQRGQ